MRLWCWKNKYLISSRVNEGLSTQHKINDCHECKEPKCELPEHIRLLPPHGIGLYFQWMAQSPADILLYLYRINIYNRIQAEDAEYKAFKLLYSLPPELHDDYWTGFYLAMETNEDMDVWTFGNKIEELIDKAKNEYEYWSPSKPYWENTKMRKRNG
jgi:hypothetical protein